MPAPRSPAQVISTGLEPVSGPDPEILILGSFPGRISLRDTAYYGNVRNHFWMVMEAVFGIDAGLPYDERIARVKEHRLALWDVVGSCRRPGSADTRISEPVFNDIAGFVRARPALRLVALNGSTAGRYYRRISGSIPLPFVILPSTSPANAGMTPEEKIRRWSVLADG